MKHTNQKFKLILKFTRKALLFAVAALFLAATLNAQTTLFSFQGKLPNDVTPASDNFEMEFRLFDAAAGGTQIGATNTVGEVAVKARSFTVWLDFGAAAFDGADRFIEISYRRSGGNQPFTIVFPREQILSVPYAIRALNATTADNINGVDFSNFVLTTDARLSDSRDPNPGSDNYIQNTTALQNGANFNIGGTGQANIFSAVRQFNIRENRILSAPGSGNLFVGIGAGANNMVGLGTDRENTTGISNTFVGDGAGLNNTTGNRNVFIGQSSGNPDTTTQVSNSVAIGNNAVVSRSNTIVLGTAAQQTVMPGKVVMGGLGTGGIVAGGGGFLETFDVNGVSGIFTGNIVLTTDSLNAVSRSDIPVCMRLQFLPPATGGNVLTRCVDTLFSSFAEKTDIKPFTDGLNVIKRLDPVSFKWKADGKSGIGLNAEDVAEAAPSLVKRSEKGEIEDVKKDGLNVLFINAFKQQQAQIEAQEENVRRQQEQIKRQQQEINALKKLVCQTNAEADLCKTENGIADRLPVRSPF